MARVVSAGLLSDAYSAAESYRHYIPSNITSVNSGTLSMARYSYDTNSKRNIVILVNRLL